MVILFPSEPYELKTLDPDFADQREAARAAGFETALIDTDEMRVAANGLTGPCLYRGWMLTPKRYGDMCELLARRGLELLTSPEQYRYCHYLPEWYNDFREETPQSLWTVGSDYELGAVAKTFGQRALVLKDYVKSEKHYWKQACFIPSAQDPDHARSVVEKFLELRYGEPEGGLVFREFLPFQSIGTHQTSGMPLTLEYRLFFFRNNLLVSSRYWGEGTYPDAEPPMERFHALAQKVPSSFFTMDVACDSSGRWWIVELGDGQVSGLPEGYEAADFYQALWAAQA